MHLLNSHELLLQLSSLSGALLFLPLTLSVFAFLVFSSQSFFSLALLKLQVKRCTSLEVVTDLECIFEPVHVLLLGHGSLVLVLEINHPCTATTAALLLSL